MNKMPLFPSDDLATPRTPEQPGILAAQLAPKPLGKPSTLGIILDVIAGLGGATPTYAMRREHDRQDGRMFQKSMLAQQLEEAQWQRRQDYLRQHPTPYRFEANNGDQMEYDPMTGQPRTLYKDPTPKIDWIQVKDPATGAVSIVPRPQGGSPAAAPPGVTFKPRAGGASPSGSRTFPVR